MQTAMTKSKYTAMLADGSVRMKVLLRHNSGIKGSEGLPGDVVEVTAELGKRWIEEGAAEATKDSVTPAEERHGTPERAKLAEGT